MEFTEKSNQLLVFMQFIYVKKKKRNSMQIELIYKYVTQFETKQVNRFNNKT